MRRTRIIVTAGPSCDDAARIRALIDAGADAFRLNFSHGTAATHAATCARIREAAKAAGRTVAVLQDLGGPKIRIGVVDPPINLADDSTLVIEKGDFPGEAGRVSCSFDALFTSVRPGHRLLVDDGKIELDVRAVAPGRIETRVVAGGPLESHKGINVPDAAVRTSALTPKDLDDLRAGIAMGVDAIAVSFVQSPEDVLAARAAAAAAGAESVAIIAKIERPQAVERIEEILAVVDGLMVARGDLGLELPLETLPAVQRTLILAARRRGVPVIVATQVLESMRTEPRPTRAEVTDAAHAVDESVDSIMLAGETASGRYPVRAVTTLDAIIVEAEKVAVPSTAGRLETPGSDAPASGAAVYGRALCEAAVTLAERARASAIVALTETGTTARMLASLRPSARILAATANASVAARSVFLWGTAPVVVKQQTLATVRDALVAQSLVPTGAVVVFVAVRQGLGRDGGNFVHVERL
jgi:pyruvate kinase